MAVRIRPAGTGGRAVVPAGHDHVVLTGSGRPVGERAHCTASVWVPSIVALVVVVQGAAVVGLASGPGPVAMIIRVCGVWVATLSL